MTQSAAGRGFLGRIACEQIFRLEGFGLGVAMAQSRPRNDQAADKNIEKPSLTVEGDEYFRS